MGNLKRVDGLQPRIYLSPPRIEPHQSPSIDQQFQLGYEIDFLLRTNILYEPRFLIGPFKLLASDGPEKPLKLTMDPINSAVLWSYRFLYAGEISKTVFLLDGLYVGGFNLFNPEQPLLTAKQLYGITGIDPDRPPQGLWQAPGVVLKDGKLACFLSATEQRSTSGPYQAVTHGIAASCGGSF